ncbi:ABC transporter substrate-binding protein [Ornithinibacillus halophilus]|uniref:Carbohydrate ABC transporter substrate-binding protein, CUT1 family n=1 Tax=Ornithinibacillus halophilus TaxID=930117 RepID=A0A1M5FUH7_9BACI|nr:ABC transporter substrate-binding protein [Ornithinibacillus halophilus]SHF95044.1 carbohydrate ABC transporter substrate-binding protein, CUT1 family [Ornithinibacillus halophilus]
MNKFTKGLAAITLGSALLLAGCGGDDSGSKDGKVTLELFSNKSESIDTYKGLIEEFESQNPDINIKLEAPPEAETVLKTRLTKDDLPDIMSIGGNATFGELARAGVFHDFTDSDALSNVQSSYVDMLGQLVGPENDGVYALPYATNANTVIYNKQKVEELNIDIPTNWDEFIAALETAQGAGEIPLYFTLQEAWTAMPIWNGVAGNLVADDFAERKNNNEASFQEEYDEVADKMLELMEYGQGDNFSVGYGDGNNAFANGEGVFYIQGNWAIPEILKANPDVELGTFALPSHNQTEENNLVSGVDVALTVSETTPHKEEALTFIEFLISQETAQQYIDEQKAFSAVEGVFQEDPVFEGIRVNFEEGTLTSFVDHYYPAGMGAENLVQDFLIKKDKEAALQTLDSEWDKVINR